jgi:hypothetical protein
MLVDGHEIFLKKALLGFIRLDLRVSTSSPQALSSIGNGGEGVNLQKGGKSPGFVANLV